ncbi:MAG: thioredoxin family protein [Bacteroidota bacterium]
MKNRSSLQHKPTPRHRLQLVMNLLRHWPAAAMVLISIASIRFHQADQDSVLRQQNNSWEVVKKQALEQDQLCLLFFTSEYCFSCETAENMFQAHEELQAIVKAGYQAKSFFPMERAADQALAQQYGVESLPAFLITTPDGKLVKQLPPTKTAYHMTNALERAFYLREIPTESSLQASDEPKLESTEVAVAPSQWAIAYPPAQWAACVKQAELSRHEWNRGVWIQASKDQLYQVVLGAFDYIEEAETTAEVLKAWGQESNLAVIPLPSSKLPLLGSL